MMRVWVAALLAMIGGGSSTAAMAQDADDCDRNTIVLGHSAAACHRLAEQGVAEAQWNLGLVYYNGLGVPQDYKQAAEWYRKAADQGFAKAQHNLGWLYEFGEGTPQDYKQAAEWYRKAADQGDAGAQNDLGTLYANGNGVPQLHSEAVKWYRQAADQGFAAAQYNLGSLYAAGQGVPQDYVHALMWIYLGSAGLPAGQGRDEAAKDRDFLASLMAPSQIEEAQRLAREWKPKTNP
jgi:TPR repeat protein